MNLPEARVMFILKGNAFAVREHMEDRIGCARVFHSRPDQLVLAELHQECGPSLIYVFS